MSTHDDTFGINVRTWCAEHEQWVRDAPGQGLGTKDILAWHERKLAWLQHERLIHLIVLVMTVIGEIALIGFAMGTPNAFPASWVLLLIVTVVLAFYVRHYFFLENTVQHWYRIAEELHRQL